MRGYKITPVDGDVAVGRNAEVGGDVDIQGKGKVRGTLRVEGFLDAPHIKGTQKGLFRSEEELNEAYPNPHVGWFAIVLDSADETKGFLYRAEKNAWVKSAETAHPYEFIVDSINVFASKGELEYEKSRAENAEMQLRTDMETETANRKDAIDDIKGKAARFGTFASRQEGDGLKIIYSSLDNTEGGFYIPAATTEKAGVMSAYQASILVMDNTIVNGSRAEATYDVAAGKAFLEYVDIKGSAGETIKILITSLDGTAPFSSVTATIAGEYHVITIDKESNIELTADIERFQLYKAASAISSSGSISVRVSSGGLINKVTETREELQNITSLINDNSQRINDIGGLRTLGNAENNTSLFIKLDSSKYTAGELVKIQISNVSNEDVDYFNVAFHQSGVYQQTACRKSGDFTSEITLNRPSTGVTIKGYSGGGALSEYSGFRVTVTLTGEAETVNNKVASLSYLSTDTQYPTAKCVFTEVSKTNNVLGETYVIHNDSPEESVIIHECNPLVMCTGRQVCIHDINVINEDVDYLQFSFFGKGGNQYTQVSKGQYFSDKTIVLSHDIHTIKVETRTDEGSTVLPSGFTLKIDAIGLSHQVNDALLYTPRADYIVEESAFSSRITELDKIQRKEEYDYSLSQEKFVRIDIVNQDEFDNLSSAIASASQNYNNIYVEMRGEFVAGDSVLDLSTINNTNLRLCLGGSAKILGRHEVYKSQDALYCTGTHNVFLKKGNPTVGSVIFTGGNEYIGISESGFNTASGADIFDSVVESTSTAGQYKAKLPSRLSNLFGKELSDQVRLWYACQWSGRLCVINNIDVNGYIYFVDNNKSPLPTSDKNPTRFVLMNIPCNRGIYFDDNHIYVPVKYDKVYQHDCSSTVVKGVNKSANLCISGLQAVGFGSIITNRLERCKFSHCLFSASKEFASGEFGMMWLGNNCEVSDCEFVKFLHFKMYTFGDTIIERNKFSELMLLQVGNPLGISLVGGGLQYFSQNKCIDFPNQMLRIGLAEYGRDHYPDYSDFRVIVENNEFCCSSSYKYDRYSCYDAGAVYLYLNTCNAIVRYNYIHDIKGYVTHGIYCDDGAYGFAIYKNIVCNVMDGYSINSRTLTKTQMAEKMNTDGHSPNVDNLMIYNIINAPYLFKGSTEYSLYANDATRSNNGCYCSMNLLMEMLQGDSERNNIVADIYQHENDVESKATKLTGNVIKAGVILSQWNLPSTFKALIKYYTV